MVPAALPGGPLAGGFFIVPPSEEDPDEPLPVSAAVAVTGTVVGGAALPPHAPVVSATETPNQNNARIMRL